MSIRTPMQSVRSIALVGLATLTLLAGNAGATAIVTGSDTNVFVTGITIAGTSLSGIADGFDATNMAVPSTFSVNFLVHGDGTTSSASFSLSQMPYTVVGGIRYFAIVYDSQETGNARSVQLDNITLTVNGVGDVWSSTEPILLNSTTPYTNSPQGNGPDMAVFIPVSAFDGLGLTGSSTAFLTVTQSLSDNGSDEWEWTDGGIIGGVTFFGPDDPISSGAEEVPEPLTFLMAGGALIGLGLITRRVCS